MKNYGAAKYSNVKFLTEVESALSLVRNESSWAYDLVKQATMFSPALAAA